MPLLATPPITWAYKPSPSESLCPIQTGSAVESCGRPSPADVLQHRLVVDQRLTGPIRADQAEHPVLDRVPLRRPRRVVGHGDDQPELIGQALQARLPGEPPIAVGPAAIRLDEQPPGG